MDFHHRAGAFLDLLEELDVRTEQDLLNQESHSLEPKVKLALLEEFLGFAIAASLQELEECLADGEKVL